MNHNKNSSEDKNYYLTEWDKQCMAYHEAGHAVCHHFLSNRKILKITISPNDEAFGMMQIAPNQNHNETAKYLKNSIAVLLAGELVEKYYLGEKTTSIYSDLQIATQIASDMVTKYNMGKKVQLISKEIYSEKLMFWVEKDIISILKEAEVIAKKIVMENKQLIEKLANLLLQQLTLTQVDLEMFFDKWDGLC